MPWSASQKSVEVSAVAVLRQGFGHARRGATTGAGLDVQTTCGVTAVAVLRAVRGVSLVQFMGHGCVHAHSPWRPHRRSLGEVVFGALYTGTGPGPLS